MARQLSAVCCFFERFSIALLLLSSISVATPALKGNAETVGGYRVYDSSLLKVVCSLERTNSCSRLLIQNAIYIPRIESLFL
jgi:hypothetical protein